MANVTAVTYYSMGNADGYDPDGLLTDEECERLLQAWHDLAEEFLSERFPGAEIAVEFGGDYQGVKPLGEQTQVYEGDDPWTPDRVSDLEYGLDAFVMAHVVERAEL